ncbi:methylated-DNA-[protein]-cysteine S-methyltransferase [Clostridium algifaecis]|uniref:Methylated-DNA--protein-cysteine methyltransferase n=1 Tax=Clostridium algifaecis TaxID=1472040 RepID=A0ABS4KTE3_9CLOT|nr:methylated-DNA--[protein]-cysteine S-methyltransferase [Clostridium algifaecis]MBP2032855.1 methylated-DNA-[protein]-cysteine S-methyltransferase [Clostridium algifaecis]
MISAYNYEFEIGKMVIVEENSFITNIYFGEVIPENANIVETQLIKKAYGQLQEYFNGSRKMFNLPLAAQGTDFQRKVWNYLQYIPYGKTCSYKNVADGIGNKKASRAVGMANNKNPILIVIPCHRVIGVNGSLVGYAGGLDVKKKLLNMEKINV